MILPKRNDYIFAQTNVVALNQPSKRLTYSLISLGISFEAGLLGMIGLGNLTQQVGFYLGLSLVLFLIFILATRQVLKITGDEKARPDVALLVILFFAVLFRLTLVFAAPSLSTDQFRYIWEGRLVTQGLSPYQFAPNDPQLLPYRSEIWPIVQQKEYTSPYPPLSLLIGAVEYKLFGESLLGPKITAVFFDLLACLLLVWLLSRYGLAKRRIIFYAWCPLPILEFGISGHNDAPMLCLLLLAVGLAHKRRPLLSAWVLGLACLAKFTPIVGLPIFLVVWAGYQTGQAKWDWRQAFRPRLWIYPALTIGTVVIGYLPFLLIGRGALGSILEYTGTWLDNEGLVYQIAYQLGGIYIAKILSLVLLVGGVGVLAFHPRLVVELSLPRRLMLTTGLTLLVTSAVHSWYVTWILIFVPLVYGEGFKNWDRAWLLFGALVQLPYLDYQHDPQFWFREWIRPLQYWPLHLLIILNVYQWWRKRPRFSSEKARRPEPDMMADNANHFTFQNSKEIKPNDPNG